MKPKPTAAEAVDLDDPRLYVNRELGLLAFQWRVLDEARDPGNPLLERVKFLSIVGSNLDEFFMVRVAGLRAQVDAGVSEAGPDRMSPSAQLVAVRREVRKLLETASSYFSKELLPSLGEQGVHILKWSQLSPKQVETAKKYFAETVFPVLTPLAFDPGRPFPHISNLSLNLGVSVRDRKGVERFARVKVPGSLPRLVPLTRQRKAAGNRTRTRRKESYAWLEDVIAANLDALFPGMEILESHPFHVVRDADIAIKELEAEDLLETIEEGVRQRRFGSVIRLDVSREMAKDTLNILTTHLDVDSSEVYRSEGGLLGLSRLEAVSQIDRPDLKYPPFVPAYPPELKTPPDENLFSVIRNRDVLLHHPFQSFQPVVDFLKQAARDPDVLAIKMVLYRVGRNSPVVRTLLDAIENGKQVAVLMELKARFDEGSNIEWAKTLERAGCHVVYGLLGLKIHAKATMVLRREGQGIQPYLHLATGNYNVVTAHQYTDIGLFTANAEIAAEVIHLFNFLTGYSAKQDYRKLLVAPVNLRERFEALVKREMERHKSEGGGHLVFKMNALVDPGMICLLYRASQAGVKIDLLVRGICCLKPGIPGVSENIRVTSIVGRFLEHSRIFYFRNGGEEEIYIGSADLMPRNLNRRVELMFPIEDPELRQRLRDDVLTPYLLDNVKARHMTADGSYKRAGKSGAQPALSSQEVLSGKPLGRRKRARVVW